MLRRNYRRTRSDETNVRSAAAGEDQLTGAMMTATVTAAATASAGTTASGTGSDGGGGGSGDRRPQSRRDRTPMAFKRRGSTAAGNGTLATGSRSNGGGDYGDDDYDDDDDDSVDDDSPRTGHRRHRHRRDHRPVTVTESCRSTPFRHNPSVGSADTEISSLDTRELWLPDTEPTPSTMSALHQFGAEMLRLSRGLEKVASPESKPTSPDRSRSVFVSSYGVGQNPTSEGFKIQNPKSS